MIILFLAILTWRRNGLRRQHPAGSSSALEKIGPRPFCYLVTGENFQNRHYTPNAKAPSVSIDSGSGVWSVKSSMACVQNKSFKDF